MDLRAADVIVSLDVLKGEAAQAAVLNQRYADIPAAVEAINAAFTEVGGRSGAAERRGACLRQSGAEPPA